MQKEYRTPFFLKTLPQNCVITDIETTGLNPAYDSIIEISALKIENDKITGEFSSLVNPMRPVSYFITKLTGINSKMLARAKDKNSVLMEFCAFIQQNPIVGHNVKFDLSFINKNLSDCNKSKLTNSYTDTLYFSRRIYKNLSSHKLTNIAQYLNIDTKNAHRALKDCYMTYYIMQDMKKYLNQNKKGG